jgi:hypothetical protein
MPSNASTTRLVICHICVSPLPRLRVRVCVCVTNLCQYQKGSLSVQSPLVLLRRHVGYLGGLDGQITSRLWATQQFLCIEALHPASCR